VHCLPSPPSTVSAWRQTCYTNSALHQHGRTRTPCIYIYIDIYATSCVLSSSPNLQIPHAANTTQSKHQTQQTPKTGREATVKCKCRYLQNGRPTPRRNSQNSKNIYNIYLYIYISGPKIWFKQIAREVGFILVGRVVSGLDIVAYCCLLLHIVAYCCILRLDIVLARYLALLAISKHQRAPCYQGTLLSRIA